MTRRAALPVLVMTLGAVTSLAGQRQRPTDWRVRFDRAGVADSAISFVTMPPGWHVTTKTGALLFDPTMRASGSYRVETQTFSFPGEGLGGWGLVVGGRELHAASASYVAFLISRDGRLTIERHHAGATESLVAWRRDTAVAPHPGTRDEDVANVLAVDVDPDSLGFLANGTLVARIARPAVWGDQLGLRVGDSLNLHISKVTVMWGGRRR